MPIPTHKWERARKALIWTGRCAKVAADRCHPPAPKYVCGQRVWLSTKNLRPKDANIQAGTLLDWEVYGPVKRC